MLKNNNNTNKIKIKMENRNNNHEIKDQMNKLSNIYTMLYKIYIILFKIIIIFYKYLKNIIVNPTLQIRVFFFSKKNSIRDEISLKKKIIMLLILIFIKG